MCESVLPWGHEGNMNLWSKENSVCTSICPIFKLCSSSYCAANIYTLLCTDLTIAVTTESLMPFAAVELCRSPSQGHWKSHQFLFYCWSLYLNWYAVFTALKQTKIFMCIYLFLLWSELQTALISLPPLFLFCFHSSLFFPAPVLIHPPRVCPIPPRFSGGALGHGTGLIFTLFPLLNATSS